MTKNNNKIDRKAFTLDVVKTTFSVYLAFVLNYFLINEDIDYIRLWYVTICFGLIIFVIIKILDSGSSSKKSDNKQ